MRDKCGNWDGSILCASGWSRLPSGWASKPKSSSRRQVSVVKLMAPHVKRMVIANPLQVRAIAHAKVKTDKIDAVVLAKLHAAGFLPEVWQPDDATERLRRQVARRATIVHSRTRVKNRIQSVLHANLILPYKGDLFSGSRAGGNAR
jgi:hypothetical protein